MIYKQNKIHAKELKKKELNKEVKFIKYTSD